MEKHECKLCFKSFSNGRALGGHMRSHMKKLPLPPKPEHASPPHTTTLLSFEAESASASSSSSSEDDDEGEEDDKALSYGLRENPKKSIRLADPEFSFVVNNAHGSVILQDRESETESSRDPTRSRRSSNSKRAWKLGADLDRRFHHNHHHREIQELPAAKKLKSKSKTSKTESSTAEPEPVSSVSDATTEEDVAFWLMMLSRDKWKRQKDAKVRIRYDQDEEDEEEEEEEDDDEDEDDEEEDEEEEEEEEEEGERSVDETDEESEENFKSSKNNRTRGRYTCETCKKAFRSYQALGGHRASHKKIKISTATAMASEAELEIDNNGGGTTSSSMAVVDKKIHECPFCFRVFSSGQALGGHKRTHLTASASSAAATVPIRASTKFVENLIDLNLPAPMEEDDASQIENSGVSYAEFVNSIRQ